MRKKLSYVAIGFMLIAAVFIYLKANRQKKQEEPPVAQTTPQPTDIQTPAEEAPGEVIEQPDLVSPQEITESEPTIRPDKTKTREEAELITRAIANAAQQMYAEYAQHGTYVSKRGYFFEQHSDSYVKPQTLVDITDVKPEYVNDNTLILYVKPRDIKEITNLAFESSEELELYAAFEYQDGVFISSVNAGEGLLTKEQLTQLLDKYNYQHGDVQKVEFESKDFSDIIDTIKEYSNNTQGFDIRSLFKDDKYAVAVVSPKDDTTKINQYILENRNDQWFVVIGNFEKLRRFIQEINTKYTDLNLELVPKYNMFNLERYINAADENVIVNSMKLSNIITEKDGAVTFSSCLDDFIYLEFESGVKFLGHKKEAGDWKVYPIQRYEDGVATMKSLATVAPTFILKQN